MLFASADPAASRVFASVSRTGMSAALARTGVEALALSSRRAFDLAFIDEELGDRRGLEVARVLRQRRHSTPFVLFGHDVPTQTTVEAMKLGASIVFNKPLTVRHVATAIDVARLAGAIGVGRERHSASAPRPVLTGTGGDRLVPDQPRSTVDRWARLVLRACESDADFPTLAAWATFVGLSYSSLCEYCRLLNLQPRDARDFARLLRSVIRARLQSSTIVEMLSIGDRRTLQALLARGGLDRRDVEAVTVEWFLDAQQFIPLDNPGLMALKALLLS